MSWREGSSRLANMYALVLFLPAHEPILFISLVVHNSSNVDYLGPEIEVECSTLFLWSGRRAFKVFLLLLFSELECVFPPHGSY